MDNDIFIKDNKALMFAIKNSLSLKRNDYDDYEIEQMRMMELKEVHERNSNNKQRLRELLTK